MLFKTPVYSGPVNSDQILFSLKRSGKDVVMFYSTLVSLLTITAIKLGISLRCRVEDNIDYKNITKC